MHKLRTCEVMVLAFLLFSVPQQAFAYIDPGMGSLLVQGAIAGFVAVAGAWAIFRAKVAAFFGRFARKSDAPPK